MTTKAFFIAAQIVPESTKDLAMQASGKIPVLFYDLLDTPAHFSKDL